MNDLFAPFVLEIDVDIGRLVAGVGNEAFEKKVRSCGIDLCNAENVADRGIGGRSASLMEDALLSRKSNDIFDRQKKRRVVEPPDQLKFVRDLFDDIRRRAIRIVFRLITPCDAFPGQTFEPLLRVFSVRRNFIGIFVGQLFEIEAAAICEFERVCQRFGIVREKTGHFRGGFEMTFGIAGETKTGFIDGASVADAGEHILQAAARWLVIENVVRR